MLQQLNIFEAKPAPPPSEEEKRVEAMAKMLGSAERRNEILRRAKTARHLSHCPAAGLMRYGVPHMVTADMVNEALDIPVMRARTRTRDANNINGAIFVIKPDGKDVFVKLRQIRSKRENSHGRLVWAWCLQEYETVCRPIFERAWDTNGNRRSS